MKVYIKSAAMKKSDVGAWVEARTSLVIEAITQLYLFPNNENRDHWKQEVWANFRKVPSLKRVNKAPSAQFIYDNSWGSNSIPIWKLIEYVIQKESKYEPDYDKRDNYTLLEDTLDEYFQWLSIQLGRYQRVEPPEVYKELEKLGL